MGAAAVKEMKFKFLSDSKDARKDFKRTQEGLEGVKKSAKSGSSGFSKLGKTAALGGAAAVGAVGVVAAKGISEFAAFENKMAEVFTLLPGISGEAKKGMEKQLKGFMTEFGVEGEQATQALYDSLSAGVPQDNVYSFMEDAQKLARGGNVELSSSVDLLTSGLNAYGLDASEAGKMSDVFFTTVAKGKTTIDEIGASLSNVAPIAAANNVSFQDVGASIATLTAQGVPTAEATTQMRAAFSELSKDTSGIGEKFKQITGKSFPEFMKSGKNMGDVMAILSEESKKSGVSIANLFSSQEAGGAISAMNKDIEGFNENLNAMNNSAGATGEAFETMENTTTAKFDKMKANLQVIFIDIGAAIAPLIETFSKVMSKIDISKIGELFEKTGPIVESFVDSVMEFINKVANNESLKKFLKQVKEFSLQKLEDGKKIFNAFKDALVELWNSDAMKGLKDALKKLGQAIGKAFGGDKAKKSRADGEKWKKFFVAVGKILTKVLTWVIKGITLYVKYVGFVIRILIKVGKFIWKVIKFFKNFGENMEKLKDKIPEIWEKIKAAFKKAVDKVADILKPLPGKIWKLMKKVGKRIWKTLGDAWEYAKVLVRKAIKWLKDYFKKLPGNLWRILKKLGKIFGKVFGFVKEKVIAGAKAVLKWLWNFLKGLPGKLWNAIKLLIPWIWKVWGKINRKIIDAMKWVLKWLWNFIKGLPRKLWNILKKLIPWMWRVWVKINHKIKQAFKAVLKWVIKFLISLPGKIWRFLKKLIPWMWEKWQKIVGKIKEALKKAIKWVINFFKELPGKIVRALRLLASKLKEKFKSAGKKAFEAIKDGIAKIWDFFKDLPGDIADKVTGLYDKFKEKGQQVIDGLKDAIANGISTVIQKVADLGDAIKKKFKEMLGIASPSKVFRGYGDDIVEGLNLGVKKKMDASTRLVKKLSDDLTEAAKVSVSVSESKESSESLAKAFSLQGRVTGDADGYSPYGAKKQEGIHVEKIEINISGADELTGRRLIEEIKRELRRTPNGML